MNLQNIEIKDILKHEEFDKTYMEKLQICSHLITTEENKAKKYCSQHCTNNCYLKQKHYFEQYVCLIRNPETIYIEQVKDKIVEIKPTGMAARYRSFSKFLTKWEMDTSNKTYSRIDFFPDKSKCPKDVYNSFNGFAVEKVYIKQE